MGKVKEERQRRSGGPEGRHIRAGRGTLRSRLASWKSGCDVEIHTCFLSDGACAQVFLKMAAI